VEKPTYSSEVTEEKQWVDLVKKSFELAHIFKHKKQSRYIAFNGLFFNRKKIVAVGICHTSGPKQIYQ